MSGDILLLSLFVYNRNKKKKYFEQQLGVFGENYELVIKIATTVFLSKD